MSKVDLLFIFNAHFLEDFSHCTYVVLVTGFRPAASFSMLSVFTDSLF